MVATYRIDLENTAGKTLFVRSLFAFGLMFLPTLGFGIIFPLANRIHLSLFGSVTGNRDTVPKVLPVPKHTTRARLGFGWSAMGTKPIACM